MLWAVRVFRDRFRLRLNEDEKKFRTYDVHRRQWHEMTDGCAGSLTATLTTDLKATRIKLSSYAGYRQTVMLVNTRNNRVTGFIRVNEAGSIHLADTPTFIFEWPVPEYWTEKITAIVGIDGAFTANISDCVGSDEDIVRLKKGHRTIFIPARYAKPTDAYDYTNPMLFSTPTERSFTDSDEPQASGSGVKNEQSLHVKAKPEPKQEDGSEEDTEVDE